MPKPDKHAAASQAVDILEEIATMLVCTKNAIHFIRLSISS
jgi:hypothetical protein